LDDFHFCCSRVIGLVFFTQSVLGVLILLVIFLWFGIFHFHAFNKVMKDCHCNIPLQKWMWHSRW
jgi:fumarate reductase subunit D